MTRAAASSQANRGRALEDLIIATNEQYRARGVAVVQKIWTPTRVIRKGPDIVSAFHAEKSTVDFVGTYQGQALAFDVKSTRLKTRWPLNKLDAHQLEFLIDWQDRGGIGFVLIEFALSDQVYLVPLRTLVEYVADSKASISIDACRQEGQLCRHGSRGFYLDYLAALDKAVRT